MPGTVSGSWFCGRELPHLHGVYIPNEITSNGARILIYFILILILLFIFLSYLILYYSRFPSSVIFLISFPMSFSPFYK